MLADRTPLPESAEGDVEPAPTTGRLFPERSDRPAAPVAAGRVPARRERPTSRCTACSRRQQGRCTTSHRRPPRRPAPHSTAALPAAPALRRVLPRSVFRRGSTVTADQAGDAPVFEAVTARIRVPRTGPAGPRHPDAPWSWPTARTHPARPAVTCAGARSARSSHSRRTRSSMACDAAAEADARPASTATQTSSGTPSSGASTASNSGAARPHEPANSPLLQAPVAESGPQQTVVVGKRTRQSLQAERAHIDWFRVPCLSMCRLHAVLPSQGEGLVPARMVGELQGTARKFVRVL